MIALRAKRIITGDAVLDNGIVTIEGDTIVGVGTTAVADAPVLDLGELDLLPGLVDLHSDCLEEIAHPRPGREQPLTAALLQLDAEVAAHGITTHFLCATMEDDPLQHRSTERTVQTVNALESLTQDLRIEHLVHLRVELTGDAFELAQELADRDVVGLVSYMHHTPGHGQFAANPEAWKTIYANEFEGTAAELEALVDRRRERAELADQRRAAVAAIATSTRTPLASHDDVDPSDAAISADLGARIAEFPLSADTAAAARALGLGVVMGAPNAWRGSSHLGGLGARDVLAAGHLTALVSDYHPPSLLPAVYALAGQCLASWPDAIALVTANPARLANLDDRGQITPGHRADLIAVERIGDHPVVRQAWLRGHRVLGLQHDSGRPVP